MSLLAPCCGRPDYVCYCPPGVPPMKVVSPGPNPGECGGCRLKHWACVCPVQFSSAPAPYHKNPWHPSNPNLREFEV